MEIIVPLEATPRWMEGLVFSKQDNKLEILVRKNSGSDYGYVHLTRDQLMSIMTALEIPHGEG